MEGNWKNFRIQSSFPATEFLTSGRIWVGRKRSRILHPSDRGISYKVDVHLLRKKRTNKETNKQTIFVPLSLSGKVKDGGREGGREGGLDGWMDGWIWGAGRRFLDPNDPMLSLVLGL